MPFFDAGQKATLNKALIELRAKLGAFCSKVQEVKSQVKSAQKEDLILEQVESSPTNDDNSTSLKF
jgi:hypothetical protein